MNGQSPQVALTVPILEGLDGVQKMSKSLGNYVGITEKPSDMFGKIMSISDQLMFRYYLLLSDKSLEEIEKIKKGVEDNVIHPMDAKKDLAEEIVKRFHGYAEAKRAREWFEQVFSKKELPEDIKEFDIARNEKLIDVIKNVGFAPSNSEVRRLASSGAISLNGEKIENADQTLGIGEYILKVGKRNFAKLIVK